MGYLSDGGKEQEREEEIGGKEQEKEQEEEMKEHRRLCIKYKM